MMVFPHPTVRDVIACSRLVTLPDWQGMGLAMILIDRLGSLYRALGRRTHTYPAHPALIRAFDKSAQWAMVRRPGGLKVKSRGLSGFGDRPCAVFEFLGEAHPDAAEAARLTALREQP